MPVPPRDPASAISTVVDLVHGGKLNAMAPCMASLGPHQSDKMQGVQVNLQKLLQVIGFHWNLGTPGSIPFFWVQPWWMGVRGKEGTMKPQLFVSPQQAAASPEGREQAGSPVQMDTLGSSHQSDCHHHTHLRPVPSPWGTMKPRKTLTTKEMVTCSLYFPPLFRGLKGSPMQWNPPYPLFFITKLATPCLDIKL